MNSRSYSKSWSDGESSGDDRNGGQEKHQSKSPATQQAKKDDAKAVKDLAYSRIEKAKQAGKSKRKDEKAKKVEPTPPATQSEKQPTKSKRSTEPPKTTQPTLPSSSSSTNEPPAVEKATGSEAKKDPATNKMDEDTVFVSDPPVRAFSLSEPIRKSITASTASLDDEDLEKLKRLAQSTSSVASDDFDHLDRQFSNDSEVDRNQMLMSTERDTAQRSTSTLPDMSTSSSSISSSMVEVDTPSSARDAMFASTSSAFEEVQRVDEDEEEKGGQKGRVISLSSMDEDLAKRESSSDEDLRKRESSSDEVDDTPLSEFRVDDDVDSEGLALKQDEQSSGIGGFFRKYWCSLMFSPIVVGSFVSILSRSFAGKHSV